MSHHPLIATCDGCGAPNGVLTHMNALFDEYHCPTCLHVQVLHDAAYAHLLVLTRESTRAWLSAWKEHPLINDLEEQFRHIGGHLADEYRAGIFGPSVHEEEVA